MPLHNRLNRALGDTPDSPCRQRQKIRGCLAARGHLQCVHLVTVKYEASGVEDERTFGRTYKRASGEAKVAGGVGAAHRAV